MVSLFFFFLFRPQENAPRPWEREGIQNSPWLRRPARSLQVASTAGGAALGEKELFSVVSGAQPGRGAASPRSGPGPGQSSPPRSPGSPSTCSLASGLCKGSEKGPEDMRTAFNCRPRGREKSTGFEVRLGLESFQIPHLLGFSLPYL